MVGTAVYGVADGHQDMKGDAFSVQFNETFFEQVIFMTGDCSKWVKMNVDQLTGDFDIGESLFSRLNLNKLE